MLDRTKAIAVLFFLVLATLFAFAAPKTLTFALLSVHAAPGPRAATVHVYKAPT